MEFLIVIGLLLAQRYWWQPLPLATLSIDRLIAALPFAPTQESGIKEAALWVVIPSMLILLVAVLLDDTALGLPLFVLSLGLMLIVLDVPPSGPMLDSFLMAEGPQGEASRPQSEEKFIYHLSVLHRELLTPILLFLVFGLWVVVAWRLSRWWLDRAMFSGEPQEHLKRLADALKLLDGMTLRVSLLVLVFWRSYRVIWTLFIRSLETWSLDLDANLSQAMTQMRATFEGGSPANQGLAIESLLNRLLLGWAGFAALLEILVA
ncbi:MAG: hypothetical protein ACO3JV_07880 [Pseudomonadales bacterium]